MNIWSNYQENWSARWELLSGRKKYIKGIAKVLNATQQWQLWAVERQYVLWSTHTSRKN
jgi:hypothetical protein